MKNTINYYCGLQKGETLLELMTLIEGQMRTAVAERHGRTVELLQGLGLDDLGPGEQNVWEGYLAQYPNLIHREFIVVTLVDHGVSLHAFLKSVAALQDAPFEELLRRAIAEQNDPGETGNEPEQTPRFFPN
jgi:hypothetical protein